MSNASERIKLALVVEDTDVWLDLLSEFVCDCGYSVVATRTIEEASSRLREFRDQVELVVADIRLPGAGSGLELVEQVKREKSTMKVIVVTSHPELETHTRARAVGALYLVKHDLTREGFVQAVRAWGAPDAQNGCPEAAPNGSTHSKYSAALVEMLEQIGCMSVPVFY